MTDKPFLQSLFEAPDVAPRIPKTDPKPAPMPDVEMPEASAPAATNRADTRAPSIRTMLPPAQYRPIFDAAAREFDVPLNVLMALGHQESRYNPAAIGTKTQWGRAKGMMQYLDDTANGLGINPLNPAESIPAAARQIRERLDKGYSMEDAVKEHFAGPNRKLWGSKTAAYGREVMAKVGQIGTELGDFVSEASDTAGSLIDNLNKGEPGRYREPTAAELAAFEAGNDDDATPAVTLPDATQEPAGDQSLTQMFKDRAGSGWDQMSRSIGVTKSVLSNRWDDASMDTVSDAILESIKDAQKKQKSLHPQEKEIEASLDRFGDSKGVLGTLKAAGDVAYTGVTNPIGLGLGTVEQASNMLPTMAGGLGGAGGGAAVGAAVGSVVPGPGSAAGAVTGALIGGRAGMATGTAVIEYGNELQSAIQEKLQEKKMQPTRESIKQLLSDEGFRKEIEKQAAVKGLTLAAVDALSFGLAGRAAAAPVRGAEKVAVKTLAKEQGITEAAAKQLLKSDAGQAAIKAAAPTAGKRVAAGAAATGVEVVGEPAGEAISQLAARGEIDKRDVAAEGLYGTATSGATAATAYGVARAGDAARRAAGPLTRSVEKVAEDNASDGTRVNVKAADGELSGNVVGVTDDGQGGFDTQIEGDDGQMYKFNSRDGVQITQEETPTGPLTSAVEAVAEEEAANPVATTEADAGIQASEQNQEVASETGTDEAQSQPETVAKVEEVAAPVAAKPKRKPAPKRRADVEAAPQLDLAPQADNLAGMDEAALRGRMKYIVEQAKINGGMNSHMMKERRRVEQAIASIKKAPKVEQAKQDQVGDVTDKITTTFAKRGEANAAMLRAAETTGLPHEVVERDGAFAIQPLKESTDGRVDSDVAGLGNESAPSTQDVAQDGADQPGGRSPDQEPGVIAGAVPGTPISSAGPAVSGAGATTDGQPALNKRASENGTNDLPAASNASTVRATASSNTEPGALPADQPGTDGAAADTRNTGKPAPALTKKQAAAIERIAKGRAWFGDKTKAADFIKKNGLSDTHEVQQTGKVRFEAKEKKTESKATELGGKDIDGDWMEFAEDSGTLKVPRADMPQIKAEHRGAMVNFLNARGVVHEESEVSAADLKPTQAEFSRKKVEKAKGFEGGDRSILVSSDGHVLDGHHQWLAKRDAGEPVKVIKLDAPITELLEAIKEFPSATQAGGATTAAPAKKPVTVTKSPGITTIVIDPSAMRDKGPTTEPTPPANKAKPAQFADNKLFTADRVEAARARLKTKLGQLNSGIDPELMIDGMTIAGAYIESGVRDFSAYAKAMTEDLGEAIKPYLLSFYEGARNYPGLKTDGMSSTQDAKAAHADLMKTANTAEVKEAIGTTEPKPAKRTKKTGAKSDMTLTQDWGVEHIDGYSDDYNRETGSSVKDAFLKEAKGYLTTVAGLMAEHGYTPHLDKKGRVERPVSVNESGVAGSGEVSLTLDHADTGKGIYVQIGGSALRGVVPNTPSGIAILFRAASAEDKYGGKGQNRWAPVDLSAADFAQMLDKEATRSQVAKSTTSPTMNTEEVQNDTQPSENDNRAGDEGQAAQPARADEGGRDAERVPESTGSDRAGADGSRAQRSGERSEVPGDQRSDTEGTGSERAPQGSRGSRAKSGDRGTGKPAGLKNYRIKPGEIAREGSWRATAARNVDIAEMVKKIMAEGRQATADERAMMTRYTGWGASEIANGVFPDQYGRYKNAEWQALGERLKAALTPAEYEQARRTTQYAHYTSESVINSIYAGLDRMGFKGGSLVEPGMGIGLFNGLMPNAMAANSQYTGIEYDTITGNIAKMLYPESNVIVGDYTKTALPKDFFDAAIGNPPFSSSQVLNDPEYKSKRPMLHDYFFMKTVDRVKPGGMLVFVTSKGTMDKTSDKSRKYLAERANLLGAIRLPQTAFKDNAGTEVVTDVIFLQKRGPGIEDNGVQWLGTKDVTTAKGEATPINEYFADHPEMVLGTHALEGSVYRANEYTVLPREGDIEAHFAEAIKNLPENVSRPARGSAAERAVVQDRDFNPNHKKEGGLYVNGNKLMQVEDGSGVALTHRSGADGKKILLTPKQIKWLTGYVGVRDALKQAQFDQLNEGDWEKSLKALNNTYDAFVKENGPILDYTTISRTTEDGTSETKRLKNASLFQTDVEGALVYALESIKEDGTIVKGVALKERVLQRPREPEIKTTNDAMFVSLNRHGTLDLDDVAALAGTTKAAVIDDLGTAIFEAPGKGWELADEYLSGNVARKLKEALAAAEVNPKYKRNIDALLAVQPRPLGPTDITVRIGANWVPATDIEAFAEEVIGNTMSIKYNNTLGNWTVELTRGGVSEFGFNKMSATEILNAVLNSRQIKVTWRDQDGKQHVDLESTEKANDIASKMRERFRTWLWTDADRADRLTKYYNEHFNNIAPRKFDGSHLTLPGVSSRYNLHPHQKRAVWRVIQQGDTYLAHAVGAGKTIEMIAAGMEERRLGLVNKPMYVVPNHMLAQFSREFLELYPAANIMVADEHNFHTHNRRRFVAQAALNNPDAIVITHSAFGRMGMSDEYSAKFIQDQIDTWKETLDDVEKGDRITIKQIERRIEQLERRLEGKQGKDKKDQVLSFEELGVDKLYVDEFHEFRKLDFATNQGSVKGIDPNGSQRALDLYMKAEYLRSKKPGRALVAASGTPVTNTMGELYTAQRFFQPEQLKEDGLDTFDAWSAQYGDVVTGFEQNAAGGYEMVARFAKFQNVPELMRRVRSFMDILTASNLGELVKRPDVIDGGRQVVVTPVPDGYKEYQQSLQQRIKSIRERKGAPKKGDDIILNVIADGRFSAIDMRFVDPSLPSDPNSKLNVWVDDILTAYRETAGNTYADNDGKIEPLKGASVIGFTDIGLGEASATNRGFDMRAWIEKRLKDAGVPADHIAFMRDFKQHAKKEKMFADMRAGKRRILIGGKEMETGVNVQKRLSNLFHLDAPWFPASVEQREGRIIRQGNQNEQVGIKAYATKGSYDSTMWGMNARKARFIEQAMNGDDNVRSLDDVSEASAFEMASALASGDERYLRLAGLKTDVERFERLRHAHYSDQASMRREKHASEDMIERNTARAAELQKAIEKRQPIMAGSFEGKVDGKSFDSREDFSMALFELFKDMGDREIGKPAQVGEIGGFAIMFYPSNMKSGYYAGLHVDIPGDPDPLLSFPIDATQSIGGIATRAANQINGMDRELGIAEDRVSEGKRKVEQIAKRLGAIFPEEAILMEKVAELNALQEELSTETEEAVSPDAAAATVDTESDGEEDGRVKLREPTKGYLNEDPYSNTETRPGTTEAQLEAGRDAVADLERRFGIDRIGKGSAGDRGQATVLGSRLVANFQAGKPNQLVGKSVKTPSDLAALAQVYRDPRFETFRTIYMKDGVVVGEEGYTSRLPASVVLPPDLAAQIAASTTKFGADGYYVMHNHPSGSALPSNADVGLTRHVAEKADGMLGHVVVDHNEYTIIQPDGSHELIDAPHLNGRDFTAAPELEHAMLGYKVSGPDTVAQLAKAMQIPGGHATLVLTNAEGVVQALVDLPSGLLGDTSHKSLVRGKAVIRRMTRAAGAGGHRFIVLPEGANTQNFDKWIGGGVVSDIVSADGNSLRMKGAYWGGDFMDGGAKSMTVRQDQAVDNPRSVAPLPDEDGGDGSASTTSETAGAIRSLMAENGGEKVVTHPELGDITIPYGDKNAGLKHIVGRRGQPFLDRIPALIATGKVYTKPGQTGRVFLGNERDEATLRLDWNGEAKTWLATAYEKYPDLKAATGQMSSREPAPNRTDRPLSLPDLKKTITSGVFGQVVYKMIDDGLIVLHPNRKTLPNGLGKGVKGQIQAVTAPDGKIHLVANSLYADNARGVLLHEAFHEGAEKLIGSAEWGALLGRGASLYRQSEQSTGKAREFFDKARARVAAAKAQGAVSTKMEVEEFLAYAIEEYANAPASIRKWVDDFIGYIKAWLVRSYGKQLGQVTPGQLKAIAQLALMTPAVEHRYGSAARYSVDLITNSPAFKRWFGNSKVVDADGKPLVVYHGTAIPKSAFRREGGAAGIGAYFTPDRAVAEDYAEMDTMEDEDQPTVMEVYLSIQNPYPMTGTDSFSLSPARRDELESMGFDGVMNTEIGEIVAFRPEQIKSATGNRGTFDPDNADIRYSVAPDADERVRPATPSKKPTAAPPAATAEEAGYTPAEQGRLRNLQSVFQDNLNRVRQVQDRIKTMTGRKELGAADYYGAEANRPGRIAARLEDAQKVMFAPLMTRLAKSGHTQPQLEELMHAMHAEERNKRLAILHPEDSDFYKAMEDTTLVGASGMSTDQANEILGKYRGNKEMHALAQQARDIAKATLDLKHAYGLIDDETHETLGKAYEYYVPLKGDGEYGPKIKRAMGHEEREEHILENIARDYDQAVMVGEKNLARQSLLRMVLEFADDKLWTARVPPKGRYVAGQVFNIVHKGDTVGSFTSRSQVSAFLEAKGDKAAQYEVLESNGDRVQAFVKPLQDNEVMVYVKGEPIRLQFHDEKLAAQLRPLDQGKLNFILEGMRGINRYLSKIYTGYNPAFMVKNTVRDAFTGTINMTGTEGVGVAAKAWARYPGALRAMGQWAATRKAPDTKVGRYLNEYRLHGGKVGASYMSDLEEQGKTLQRMYDDAYGATGYLNDGRAGKAAVIAGRKIIGGMAHVIEIGNQATENAMRLALYATLRDQGVSPGKAAQAAKAVTVDFDRKGSATGVMSALYLFFNPAVQGTANAFKTVTQGKHKEQAWVALGGLAALGFYAASQGMDDDSDRWLGENWDIRSKVMVFNIGGKQIKVPLSLEFAPIYAVGVAMGEASRGESISTSAVRVVQSFIDAYFPLGGIYGHDSESHPQDITSAVMPTVIKPGFESAFNRNRFGNQIVPESDFTKDRPDNLKMTRPTKGSTYDKTAQGIASLGEIMGAGKYENDITKVSPETLKHFWRTYTGGLGTFIADSAGMAGIAAEDFGQLEQSDIPILKDFVKDANVKPVRSRYYDLSRDARTAITEFDQAKKAGDGDALDKIFDQPDKERLIGLGRMVRTTSKAAAAMRDEAVEINADDSMTLAEKRAALKALEKDEEALFRDALEAFKD